MARYLSALCASVDRPEKAHAEAMPATRRLRRVAPLALVFGHHNDEHRDEARRDRWGHESLAEGHTRDGDARPPSAPPEQDQPLRPDTSRGLEKQGAYIKASAADVKLR
jgi:hypothetical protein